MKYPVSAIIGLVLMLWPGPILAQAWFTRDACRVDTPGIDPAVYDAAYMDDLAKAAQGIPNGVGRFWRIKTADGKVSHLWGTMHSTDPHILRLPPELMSVIKAAQVVAGEYSLLDMTRAELAGQTSSKDEYYMALDEGRSAPLDPRVAGWIDARLAAIGYVTGMVPFFPLTDLVEILLADPCDDFAAGTFPSQDNRILMLGALAGARIVGLEGANDFRKHMSDPLNRKLALDMIELYGSYLAPDETGAARAAAFDLYLQGRIGELVVVDQQYVTKIFGAVRGTEILESVEGYLLAERNPTFVASARPLLANGCAVLAVGYLHLPGDGGLIALLRVAGYKVTRIPVGKERAGTP